MLVQKEEKLIETVTRLCSKFYCFPTDFDSKSKSLIISKNKLKFILINFQAVLSTIYLLYATYKLILALKSKDQLGFLIFHVISIYIHSYCAVCFWTCTKHIQELVDIYRFLLKFNQTVGDSKQYKNLLEKTSKLKYLKIVLLLIVEATSTFFGVFWVTPNSSFYIYSQVSPEWQSFILQFLFGLLEGWHIVQYTLLVCFAMGFGFLYCDTTIYWIQVARELQLGLDLKNIKNVESITSLYSSLRILNTVFNNVLASSPWLTTLLLILTSVFPMSIYGVLKLGDRLDVISYSYLIIAVPCCICMNMGLYYPMEKLYIFSTNLNQPIQIRNKAIAISEEDSESSNTSGLGTRTRRLSYFPLIGQSQIPMILPKGKYTAKVFRSFRPLYCKLYGFGFVDQHAKQTLLKILVDSTVYLLLTF